MFCLPQRPLRLGLAALTATTLAGVSLVLADGIFYGYTEYATEHRGAGAPQHGELVVSVPLSNWSQVEMVDVDEDLAWACVRFVVTELDLAYDCVDGPSVCWPIDESYSGGKVTVVVSHGGTNKTLAKLVAKYKEGDTDWVCKSFPAANLEGASTVVFKPKARGLPAGELKLFAQADVGQSEDEGARSSHQVSGRPGPGRVVR